MPSSLSAPFSLEQMQDKAMMTPPRVLTSFADTDLKVGDTFLRGSRERSYKWLMFTLLMV